MEDSLQISIVKIGQGDVEKLRKIAIESYRDHFAWLWEDEGEWYVKKVYNQEQLQEELKNSDNLFYLVNLGKETVGYFKLGIHRLLNYFPDMHAMELERIYLLKNFQGRKIGKACMDFILDKAAKLNRALIWLKVMACSRDSIRFYVSSGFESCGGLILDFPLLKPAYREMVIMKKEIGLPNEWKAGPVP